MYSNFDIKGVEVGRNGDKQTEEDLLNKLHGEGPTHNVHTDIATTSENGSTELFTVPPLNFQHCSKYPSTHAYIHSTHFSSSILP